MLLTVDAGNTNTVFALFAAQPKGEGELLASWRLRTDSHRTPDEIAAFLAQVFALRGIDPKGVNDAMIASVVPDATPPLQQAIKAVCQAEARIFGKDIRLTDAIAVKLPNPELVGDDRLLNAIAVRELYGQAPAIVVDFGTATTFDVIDTEGAFIGGVIAPGLNLAMEALRNAAAKLPRIDLTKPQAAIGTNTVEAMQSGAYWGYIGLVEGILGRVAAELPSKPLVLATGGLATILSPDLPTIDKVEPELTLFGLRWVANQHKLGAQ